MNMCGGLNTTINASILETALWKMEGMDELNREIFTEIMNDIKMVYEYHESLNAFLHEKGAEGYIFQPDGVSSVIKLLHMIFEKEDRDEWISYFCFELEFGKKWKAGMITDKDGEDIPLGTIGDLYYLLCPESEGDSESANMD